MVTSSNPMDLSAIIPSTTSSSNPGPPSKPAAPAQVTIDLAKLSDAPAVARIGAQIFSDTSGYAVPAADLADFIASTYTPEAIGADILDAAGQATFVAREAGTARVLGFVQLLRRETARGVPGDPAAHAELRRLYVDGAAHGRGIGGALIAAVEARARDEGIEQLWLTVWEENAKAQGIYERRGYARVGKMDFATGACIQTDWVMTKAL